MKRKKQNRIKVFLLLLLCIGIGFALLSQQLDINGTSKIKKTGWSIIWDNVQVNSNSVKGEAVTQAATITNTEKTLVEYSITLSEPGEFYEFTVDAKNEGTIDGMVNVVSNKVYESNGTTEKTLPAYLTYSVTYSDGKTIAPKQLLKAGTTEKYKVRVEFKDVAASQLPAQEETIKFKFSVDYVQADETGEEVVHGLTGTKYRTLPNKSVYIGDNVSEGVTLFDTVAEAKAAYSNRPVYLKHVIESDIVKESYVCFEKDSKTYCLRGFKTHDIETDTDLPEYYDSEKGYGVSPYYESNKATLLEAFGAANCEDSYTAFECGASGLGVGVAENGGVSAYGDSALCSVYYYGNSNCTE